jgi:hypothetical protein
VHGPDFSSTITPGSPIELIVGPLRSAASTSIFGAFPCRDFALAGLVDNLLAIIVEGGMKCAETRNDFMDRLGHLWRDVAPEKNCIV